MNLHEYQAKQILAEYQLPISQGIVCQSADEVASALKRLNGESWAAKCQIHGGGRGKAGGVKLVHSEEEARRFADLWLGQLHKASLLITFTLKKPVKLHKNFI